MPDAYNGDALVAQGVITDAGYPLGVWVSKQRGAYRRSNTLAAERVARLESLSGWTWDGMAAAAEAAWEDGFARLKQYVEAHGDARVPRAFKTEDGYNLGQWVTGQRRTRSTIGAERVARLDALSGWVWDVFEADWEEGFAHLKQYVEQHGDARVPAIFKTEDGYRLGQWIHVQRRNRVTLVGERVARLEALSGWVWEMRRGPKPSR